MDCELQTYINESKGIFYIDNGHSFDKVLFYGNEFLLATFELMLFCLVLILTDDFLFSILIIGITFKVSVLNQNDLFCSNNGSVFFLVIFCSSGEIFQDEFGSKNLD